MFEAHCGVPADLCTEPRDVDVGAPAARGLVRPRHHGFPGHAPAPKPTAKPGGARRNVERPVFIFHGQAQSLHPSSRHTRRQPSEPTPTAQARVRP